MNLESHEISNIRYTLCYPTIIMHDALCVCVCVCQYSLFLQRRQGSLSPLGKAEIGSVLQASVPSSHSSKQFYVCEESVTVIFHVVCIYIPQCIIVYATDSNIYITPTVIVHCTYIYIIYIIYYRESIVSYSAD